MSISSTATKVTYSGNNSTVTPYPIPFKYLTDADVSVYFDGVKRFLGAGQDYTITGSGRDGTGSIVTNVAQADTVTVGIYLDIRLTQPVVLQETGSLPAKTLEVEGFDRLNMQIRRVWRNVTNGLRFSNDEGGAGSTGTADNLLGFNGSGDIAEIPNTTFAQTANDLSDLNDAATARTNLGVDAAGTDNSTDVTKTGAGTYISLAGQVLTVDAITESDISDLGAYIENVTGSPLSELQDVTITTPSTSQVLAWNGSAWVNTTAGNGDAVIASGLDQFAATTSLELKNTITDETGTGSLVFATSPALVTPDLGTPSAVDLTNATNYPETNGTVQGTGATTLNIAASDEGTIAGNVRGEESVDLQMERDTATQVASGANSVLVGGKLSTASGGQSSVIGGGNNDAKAYASAVIGGNNNEISGSTNYSVIAGGLDNLITSTGNSNAIINGFGNDITGTAANAIIAGGGGNEASANYAGTFAGNRNIASGVGAVVLGGEDSTASGTGSLVAGDNGRAIHNGARVFANGADTDFPSIQVNEFAIQGAALRLVDTYQGAGNVLTSDANGSGNWAHPAKPVYTVATLPATPAQGDVAMVTDAEAPTFLSAVASGGGADVVTPVFYNGTAWIVG